jgi:hypothetical protein
MISKLGSGADEDSWPPAACLARSPPRRVACCRSRSSPSVSAEHGSGTSRGLRYQPYFIAATLMFLGCGYWLVYRSGTRACAEGEACARPLSHRMVKATLILATILVAAALGLDFIASFFLTS